MLREKDIFKVRDGVDLYLIGDEIIQVYFMNTRKRMQFKANKLSVLLIEAINGKDTVVEIKDKISKRVNKEVELDAIQKVMTFFYNKGLIVENNPNMFRTYISKEDNERFDRQINFFGDFLQGAEEKYKVQKKIQDSTFLVFGCGAVASWLVTELAMCGVRNFILFDMDILEKSDISRHSFFKEDAVGDYKIDVLENYLKDINSNVTVSKHYKLLSPNTEIGNLINQADFIINTADEPYIGHTSLKISRECIKQKKAHYIAGGFDAHLASTGELIVPGITPCVDCYADHFSEVLKGWKPKPHPVKERYNEIGGLSSLSLFSASFAVIEIIKYIGGLVDIATYNKSRGEFLFDSLDITYLDVKRDVNCKSCGGG